MQTVGEVEVLELVEADRELGMDEWLDRLLVAQQFEPVYRHYVLHGIGCQALVGCECDCRLVSVFSSDRRIVTVDHLFNAVPLTLH